MSNNTNILSKSKRAHTNSVSTSIGRQSEYYRPKKSEPWYPKPCRYLTLKCFNILGTATGISGSSAYLSKLEDSVSEVTYSVIKTTCILSADNKMRFTRSGNLTVRVEDKEHQENCIYIIEEKNWRIILYYLELVQINANYMTLHFLLNQKGPSKF